jgi:hypothetical protein
MTWTCDVLLNESESVASEEDGASVDGVGVVAEGVACLGLEHTVKAVRGQTRLEEVLKVVALHLLQTHQVS